MTTTHPAPVWRLPGMPALVGLSLAGFSGYASLLSTTPQWALDGGANEAGAGLVTFALLAATVATQFGVPSMLARWGHGRVVAIGLILMGAPAPAYLISDSLLPILAVCVVRGAGFGILTVTGSAIVAHLVPADRRGEAIGVYGLAVAVPMVLVLPAAVALAAERGFAWACLLGTAPLLGVPAALALDRYLTAEEAAETLADEEPPDARTWAAVLRPTLVLTAITMSGGAFLTFLPEVAATGRVAALAIFLLGLVSAVFRWRIGAVADRRDAGGFLVPLLALGALGLGLTGWAVDRASTPMLLAGVVLLAVAYGALQNLTLVLAFAAVSPRRIPTASAAWNIGYDTGTATGAMVAGALATAYDFRVAFLVLAAVCLAAVVVSPRS